MKQIIIICKKPMGGKVTIKTMPQKASSQSARVRFLFQNQEIDSSFL